MRNTIVTNSSPQLARKQGFGDGSCNGKARQIDLFELRTGEVSRRGYRHEADLGKSRALRALLALESLVLSRYDASLRQP